MSALVSVLCVTYNHAPYIRRALDSFVMQKTDFPFEVIVHDDASTDGTTEIIREYAAKYPEIIKPIIQTENQYWRPNTPYLQTFLVPKAEGKYFAICEGDDCFTDPGKLQKQVGFLEAHPEYSMCVCRAARHFEGENAPADTYYPAEEKERDLDMHELLCRGAGMFATNSFVYRREVCTEFPDTLYVEGITDYTTLLYAGMRGKVRYIPEVLCLHNDGVAGSWTANNWQKLEKRLASDEKVIAMLGRLDAYTKEQYHASVEEAVRIRRYYMAEAKYEHYMAEGNARAARSGDCRPIWRQRKWQALKAKVKKLIRR